MIPCQCGRSEGHDPTCLVAQAFKVRCPHCHSRRRPEGIRHARNCPLREQKP